MNLQGRLTQGQLQRLMSKFEINRITIELIKAILRFRFSFLPPKREENNI
jgi:hypothetical protein